MILKNNVAIVTGGARGIGKSVVEVLVTHGWKVAFTYINSHHHAQEIVTQFSDDKVMAVQADCRNFSMVEQVRDATLDRFGQINALVNNAGITRDNLLLMQSQQEWQDVLDTNLGGVYNSTKAMIKHFLQHRQGAVVNIASVAGLMGIAGQTNYCASKFGQVGFSRALALEVAARNIRVNVVCPGFIETDMTEAMSDEQREQAKNLVPMNRFGEAKDVAEMVYFLLSDKAKYITGQTFTVDGGMTA